MCSVQNPQYHQSNPLSSSSQSHQFVFGVGEVRLLVAVVMGRPAIGHQEVKDGWVVGDLRASPAHHQGAAVHVLHLHVDGSAAAHWEEDKRTQDGQRGRTEGWRGTEEGENRKNVNV